MSDSVRVAATEAWLAWEGPGFRNYPDSAPPFFPDHHKTLYAAMVEMGRVLEATKDDEQEQFDRLARLINELRTGLNDVLAVTNSLVIAGRQGEADQIDAIVERMTETVDEMQDATVDE